MEIIRNKPGHNTIWAFQGPARKTMCGRGPRPLPCQEKKRGIRNQNKTAKGKWVKASGNLSRRASGHRSDPDAADVPEKLHYHQPNNGLHRVLEQWIEILAALEDCKRANTPENA